MPIDAARPLERALAANRGHHAIDPPNRGVEPHPTSLA